MTTTTQTPPPPPHIIIISTSRHGPHHPVIEFAKHLFYQFTFIVAITTTSAQTSFISSLPAGIYVVFLPAADFSDTPSGSRISPSPALPYPALYLTYAISSLTSSSVVALVANFFSTRAFDDVAVEFELCRYMFFPSTTLCLSLLLYLDELDTTTSCEYANLVEPVNIPGCVSVHDKDLLNADLDRKNDAYKWVLHHVKRYNLVEGIIINTFEALEKGAITMLSLHEPGNPLICPTSSVESRDWSEISEWLDEQPRGFVLFSCFGTYWSHLSEQQTKLALGLEKSEHTFLWVIKSPKDSVSQHDPLWSLSKGFLERAKRKGLVVQKWAPQIEILSHGSTGRFLSHCGWNSTLESVVYVVSLITWLLYAEQKMNVVVLAEELEVGLRPMARPDGVVGRDKIARVGRELMDGKEGRQIRTQMKELKDEANAALSKDGSSTHALEEIAQIWNSK
ncbi:hypothetical protein V2J09_008481 [Rumex salicifolius]